MCGGAEGRGQEVSCDLFPLCESVGRTGSFGCAHKRATESLCVCTSPLIRPSEEAEVTREQNAHVRER